MIYTFVDLRTTGFVVGILLIVLHGVAILHGATVRGWLKTFPRSKTMGTVLLAIDAIWAFMMMANMDLGEFSSYRKALLVLIPVAAILTLKFVDEFLAVRSLGMLMLLAAEPLLEAAFLRPEKTRLLLVVLAYAWAVLGMFYVGTPYVLRNQIDWLQKSDTRWRVATFAGLLYGVAVLISAATQYRSA